MTNKNLELYYKSPQYLQETRETLSKLKESMLPEELTVKTKARAEKEGCSYLEILNEIIEARKKMNLISFKGFHTSDIELNPGDILKTSEAEAGVCYSDNLDNLYGNKSVKWLYVIEGSNTDELYNDELGWYKTKGGRSLQIISKIRLNEEVLKVIGGRFYRELNTIN